MRLPGPCRRKPEAPTDQRRHHENLTRQISSLLINRNQQLKGMGAHWQNGFGGANGEHSAFLNTGPQLVGLFGKTVESCGVETPCWKWATECGF